jgi:orotidine-5'-phosphate decarboxylase
MSSNAVYIRLKITKNIHEKHRLFYKCIFTMYALCYYKNNDRIRRGLQAVSHKVVLDWNFGDIFYAVQKEG